MIRSTKLIFKDATSVAETADTSKLFTVVNAKSVCLEFSGTATFSATIQVLTSYQGYNLPADVYTNAMWTTVPVVDMGSFDILNAITANGLYSIDGGVAAINVVVSALSGGSLTVRYSEIY